MFKYLVQGLILGAFAILIAPEFSLKTLQYTLCFWKRSISPNSLSSCNSSINGNLSLIAIDRETCSAAAVLSAISVCSLDDEMIGHHAYFTMNPKRDLAVVLPDSAVSASQSPAKSAST